MLLIIAADVIADTPILRNAALDILRRFYDAALMITTYAIAADAATASAASYALFER